MAEGNGKAKSLTEILAIDDLPLHKVWVEPWQTHLWVRSLRADERGILESLFAGASSAPEKHAGKFRAELLLMTLVKEDGQPFLNRDVLKAFMQKSAAAIETVFEVALKVNAFREKDVEALEKN